MFLRYGRKGGYFYRKNFVRWLEWLVK